ncbi:MAG: hypothetical protein JNK66_11215 [Chitinophagales bacterium]|nr:hypothetical protein [Chitinophagales bacterium]
MKPTPLFALCLGFLFALVSETTFAQNAPKAGDLSNTETPQAVMNHAVTNADVLVMTGKIIDATTGRPITNAKINIDKFGDELMQASIDEKGNYAMALNKSELGEPIRVIFKIAGYKRYVVKNVDKTVKYVDADIYLQPMESEEKSKASIKFELNPDPFNPLVIKLQ